MVENVDHDIGLNSSQAFPDFSLKNMTRSGARVCWQRLHALWRLGAFVCLGEDEEHEREFSKFTGEWAHFPTEKD